MGSIRRNFGMRQLVSTIDIRPRHYHVGVTRIDLLVENKVIVEIKSVDAIADIYKAQLMTYMKLAGIKVGLLINFNVTKLKDGIVRWVL